MKSKAHTPEPTRYIDVLTDFGFKRIFGAEPAKDLLIDFLNSLFAGRKEITDLVYNKTEHLGDTRREGGIIFDLLCTGSDGEQFIIEVQRSNQYNFKERALFYTSRLISEQAPRGRRADWGYRLPEVYLIALLDGFVLDEESGTEKYLHDICLCERNTGSVFYDKLGFIYIELRNFTRSEPETEIEKWLYVLKNMSRLNKIPTFLRKPIFQKLFNIAEYGNLTKEEKMLYDNSLKQKWDNANALQYAIDKGRQEGREEGRQEGMEKGMEKKNYEFVLNMLSAGKFTIAEIAGFAGVSEDFVKEVRASLEK